MTKILLPHVNVVTGTVLEVEATANNSYATIYEILEDMKLEEQEDYDLWGLAGATLITFVDKSRAMEFKLRYPWKAELARGPMFDNSRRRRTQTPCSDASA